MPHTLFFDLDNTIYPKSSGVMEAIRDRIVRYMHERLGLEEPEISALRQYSLQKYGTTLLGLKERFDIDEYEFLDFVHNIDLTRHLKKDASLKALLSRYTQRKIIFSNADRNHVDRILNYLDLESLFDAVIDVHVLMPHLKPHIQAFNNALHVAQLSSWEGCVYLDDYPANIEQARKMGIYSILVDENFQYQDDLSIPSLHDLPRLIPFIP